MSYELLDKSVLRDDEDDGVFVGNDFNPIPLTEEWLLKFGFDFIDDGWASIKTKKRFINLEISLKGKRTILYNKRTIEFIDVVHIKYIHQLQNLYFALTGMELTIKK